jgi:HSP20 family protein
MRGGKNFMANESGRSGTGAVTRRESEPAISRPLGGSAIFRPFALLREMTDLMDQAVSGDLPIRGGERVWAPAVEVRQRDGSIVVDADLPGIDPSGVKVEVDDDMLVIQGERKREEEREGQGWQRSERVYGAFYRAIPLPDGAKAEQAKAEFKNGVLEVVVPVTEAHSSRRQIPIGGQTSGSSQQHQSTGSQSSQTAGSRSSR